MRISKSKGEIPKAIMIKDHKRIVREVELSTARRCAEIAKEDTSPLRIIRAITKEFGLEERK